MAIVDPFAAKEPSIVDSFAETQTPIVDPFEQKQEPTEKGGFFGSFGTSLRERAKTAIPTLALFAGVGQKKATEDILKASKESDNAYKQTQFSDIGKAFNEGNYGQALGQTVDKFKEVAGSSQAQWPQPMRLVLAQRLCWPRRLNYPPLLLVQPRLV